MLERQPTPAAALMLDLDHFKAINDTFGHDTGDHVLIQVAALLQETLGASAFCARLGGEEFCVLVSEVTSDDELLFFAERVRRGIKELRFGGQDQPRVTVSIGAARRQPHEPTAREAIVRADQALYCAKRDGRGSDARRRSRRYAASELTTDYPGRRCARYCNASARRPSR